MIGAATMTALFLLQGCGNGSMEHSIVPSENNWKEIGAANPVSANVFCADPTGVEYQGRLYMYGTNDHQQYENARKNTYEKIKSLVMMSTDDMVNWTFHGLINTEKVAPWVINSWAPSIVSRQEEDGQTHFYLYFSNNGTGVGVITATSPVGPWSDPLKRPLIKQRMPEILGSPNPFDPGAVIDGNGTGWLAFGGGTMPDGTDEMPGSARLARLGADLLSLDSVIVMPSPYFFEASEMNFINGTYVYTLNNNWVPRKAETWPHQGVPMPAQCSMAYMTSKTPLDAASWTYRGHYFLNAGESGMEYSNNHTHIVKFQGQYYIMNHTQLLQERPGIKGGFRSMMIDSLQVDEENVSISLTKASRGGVGQIKYLDPYQKVPATTMSNNADIWYLDIEDPENIQVQSTAGGAWLSVSGVDFGRGARKFTTQVQGVGHVEVRLDSVDGETVASVESCDDACEVTARLASRISGIHDLYILFSEKDMAMKYWTLR